MNERERTDRLQFEQEKRPLPARRASRGGGGGGGGASGGLGAIYRRFEDNATAGRYNCYLQTWTSGAWADADAVTVVVQNVRESSGHAFTSTSDRFLAVADADASGIVPGVPLGHAHAY